MSAADPRIFDGVGLWLEDASGRQWAGQPGLFLDRDGVIVEEAHYLARSEDLRLIAGAASAIRSANDAGIAVCVVTNQSGIGRGYFDWEAFAEVQDEMHRQLAAHGASIDFVAACAYHEEASPPLAHRDHPWRKPNAGMIWAIAQRSGVDLPNSALIGDKWSDLSAAGKAGIARRVLVRTGHGAAQASKPAPAAIRDLQADISDDLPSALRLLRTQGWPAQTSERNFSAKASGRPV